MCMESKLSIRFNRLLCVCIIACTSLYVACAFVLCGISALFCALGLGCIVIICAVAQFFLLSRASVEVNREMNQNGDIQSMKENGKAQNATSSVLRKLQIEDIIPTSYSTIEDFSQKFLSNLASKLQLVQALMYVRRGDVFDPVGSYAYFSSTPASSFKPGEGLTGQVAMSKKMLYIKNVPDNYVTVVSGLGESNPKVLAVIPIVNDKGECISVIEMAAFSDMQVDFNDLTGKIAEKIADVAIKF